MPLCFESLHFVKESNSQESLPAGSYGMAEAIYDTNRLNQLSAHLGKMNCSQVRSSAKIGIYLPPMMVLQIPAYGRDYSQGCYRGKSQGGEGEVLTPLHQKYFLSCLCFGKIDFTWCEWKNGKLRNWNIQKLGCTCVMCFIRGIAVLQSFQLCKRALVFPAVAGRVCSVIASTTHKERGNKLIKDILDTCALQD